MGYEIYQMKFILQNISGNTNRHIWTQCPQSPVVHLLEESQPGLAENRHVLSVAFC